MAKKKHNKTKVSKRLNRTYMTNRNLLANIIANKDYGAIRLFLNEAVNGTSGLMADTQWVQLLCAHIKHSNTFCWNMANALKKEESPNLQAIFCREATMQMNDYVVDNACPDYLQPFLGFGQSHLPDDALAFFEGEPRELIRVLLLPETMDQMRVLLDVIYGYLKHTICYQTMNRLAMRDKLANF